MLESMLLASWSCMNVVSYQFKWNLVTREMFVENIVGSVDAMVSHFGVVNCFEGLVR